MKRRISILLFLSVICNSLIAQISLMPFSTGYSSPVDIKNCGDERLFIVEQGGYIRICDTNGVKRPLPFLDIHTRVTCCGEQGLLGLAFPPDFATSGYFYVNYVNKPDADTRISRFHVDPSTPDSADPNSEEILLEIYQPYANHNGGHLAFGPDGYLYIGMGDGGSGGDPLNRAQNNDSLLGKILRIEVDPSIPTYHIPPSNPFAGDTSLGRPEIYTYGMRNPWRFSFDRITGDLWIGDVGQNQVEEIDFQPASAPAGLNYGWRCFEASNVYDTTGCPPYNETVAPVFQYNHTPGGCSVTGGYVCRGPTYQELFGKYFFVDYCVTQLRYLEPNGNGSFTQTNLGAVGGSSITSFGEDRWGDLYCCGSGTVYKIVSASCNPVATINTGNDTIFDCGNGFVDLSVVPASGYSYNWQFGGSTVSMINFYTATQPGEYIVTVDNNSGCSSTDTVFVDFTPFSISFSGLDTFYCYYNNNPVFIFPTLPGGTFTGPGISGATFNPTLAGPGDFTITYTYHHSNGCTYVYSQDVHVDACVGIAENLWTNTVSLYPNPSAGNFKIKAYTPVGKTIAISVGDPQGRIVYSEESVLSIGQNEIPVTVNLSSGIYFVSISDEVSSTARKLIIH